MRGGDLKQWLIDCNLNAMDACAYVDIGALWGAVTPGSGESITQAVRYTRNLTVIDPGKHLWPAVQAKLQAAGVAECQYHPIDVLDYDGPPFDVAHCWGVIYHFLQPEKLWAKLGGMITSRLLIHSVIAPDELLNHGRVEYQQASQLLRQDIHECWTHYLGTTWCTPDSPQRSHDDYSAMHQIYSSRQLRQEAVEAGWKAVLQATWDCHTALLLER